jgi:vacuolar protein sorting-associated protein 8
MDLQSILNESDSSDDEYNHISSNKFPRNPGVPISPARSAPRQDKHLLPASPGILPRPLALGIVSGGGGGGGGGSAMEFERLRKYSDASASSARGVDLEELLREDDDDEPHLGARGIGGLGTGGGGSGGAASNIGNWGKNGYSHHLGSIGTISRSVAPSLSSSHNHEDWDVLQAILGEDDDDDDDDVGDVDLELDEEWIKAASGGGNVFGGFRAAQHLLTPTKKIMTSTDDDLDVDVDAILRSDDEEDDLDQSLSQLVMMQTMMSKNTTRPTSVSAASPPGTIGWPNTWRSNSSQYDGGTNVEANLCNGEPNSGGLQASTTISTAAPGSNANGSSFQQLWQRVEPQQQNNQPLTPNEGSNDNLALSDAEELDVSRRALAHAQAYERKLLRSGHRDIVSPLMIKRRLKPKIELGTRTQQQQQKNQPKSKFPNLSDRIVLSSTPASAPRFCFSGVVENKTMPGVSEKLLKNAVVDGNKRNPVGDDFNLPTALTVNSRFIAVGTQKGIVLLFDLFEVLRQRLGATHQADGNFNAKTAGAVTSIDLSLMNGEVLAAGYTSGLLVLWDTIKGVVLRTVSEPHPSPVTSVRFLSDLKLVTVDAGGLVNKLAFSKNLLWSTYSVETECLLDGTAGQILAMDVLPPFSSVKQRFPHDNPATPYLKRLVLVALSSERSSFAVAVEPTVNVLHRWARPQTERIEPKDDAPTMDLQPGQVYLPCLSWGWALVSGGGHVITPILARAWGCCVQLLRASFPMLEDEGMPSRQGPAMELFQWPAFGVHDEFEVTAPVVALEWLSDRSLVYLTVTNEFTVVDTVMMTLLERLDFSGLRLVYAEFALSRGGGTKEASDDVGAFSTTFQNSFRSCDDRLLVLCQEELKSVSIVGAKRRISGLEQDGEWLEALALALDHYENTFKSQEDRRRDPGGRRDLSKHPEFNASLKSEDEEWIAKLLIRYLNIAVENAPEAMSTSHPLDTSTGSFPGEAQIDLAQSHFQMLAGVCVEFCVVTRRLDLLFGPIFRRFHSVGYLSVFLDILEPYILNDKLDYVAPEAMAHFVEHCRASNGIATVERCLLHMDVTIMDFDSILSLLRANEMYSALFYVFNRGLDDFTTPLEILLEKVFDAADTGPLATSRRLDGTAQNEFERYGYKAIMYLQSCFRGRTFPQDSELKPEERIHSLRPQLLRFLLQEHFSPSRNVKKNGTVYGKRSLRYPYSRILLLVDPRAMFDTMAIALDAPDAAFGKSDSNFESIGGWEVEVGESSGNGDSSRSPDRQQVIAMFLSIVLPEKDSSLTIRQTASHHVKTAVNAFLDFLAEYLMKGVVRANKSVTFMILSRMAQRFDASKESQDRQYAQSQIIELLTALPRNSYEPDEVLNLVDGAGIHRAALLLHQQGAASWHEGIDDIARRSRHFSCAIDCYLEDDDNDFRKEVFAYAKKECSGMSEDSGSPMGRGEDSGAPNTMFTALSAKLADLVHLDSLMTAELVAELFVDNLDGVVKSLAADDGGEAQFMFLQAVISGELNQVDSVAGAVLNAHLTMEHHHKYLALMANLHPELVYEYLSTHDNYRPEECLQLCQEHDIADASAYLLERMGNVSSALQLTLQTLESRMMGLKRTIRGMGTDFFRLQTARTLTQRWKNRDPNSSEMFDKQEKEVQGVKRILVVALDLCERNSGTFSKRTEHGSQLWFNVLDRLINAKGFLRLSKEQPGHAKVMAGVLSELLRLTMQRMVSSVPLPDLVRKVTSDHSGSRLGELREMIESLLSTYGLELNVFSGAVNVFHYDSQQMQMAHRALRVEGSGVRAVMNIPLDKTSIAQNKAALEALSDGGDVLQLSETGNAHSLLETGRSHMSATSTTAGLGSALSRLRTRRTIEGDASRPADRARAKSLSLMTAIDQMYLSGESGPDVTFFEERLVGALGEAEHRGRLMSFMY